MIEKNLPILIQQIVEFNDFETQLAELKSKYDGVIYDLSVPEQEKQARSDKLSVEKVIAELDRSHKKIKAPLAEKVSLIDGERKRIKDDLLGVQEKIKSQIQQHEDKIQAHADMLEIKVDDICTIGFLNPWMHIGSREVHCLIKKAKSIIVDDSYEHRKADATLAQVDTIKKLESMLEMELEYEKEPGYTAQQAIGISWL